MDALATLSCVAPGLPPLDAADRALVSALWLGRAESEARAAIVFQDLVEDLATLGAPAVLRETAARAVAEEEEHARICTTVSSAYRGTTLAVPLRRRSRPSSSSVRAARFVRSCACS